MSYYVEYVNEQNLLYMVAPKILGYSSRGVNLIILNELTYIVRFKSL